MTLLILTTLLAVAAHAQVRDADWLTYGKDHAGWRYSDLDQINTGNVRQLSLEWVFQSNAIGKNETTPLIKDNLMFVTGPENNAWALDLLTGKHIWKYTKAMPQGMSVCCGMVNRGFG